VVVALSAVPKRRRPLVRYRRMLVLSGVATGFGLVALVVLAVGASPWVSLVAHLAMAGCWLGAARNSGVDAGAR
jgi:hypothetical protein